MPKCRFVFFVLVLFSLNPFIVAVVQADDNAALIKQGRAKAQGCTHCHGRNGIAEAANRAGAESVGLFAREELLAYKSGTRSHPTMSAIAQALSDDDIDLIARWLDSVQ